MAIGLKRLAAAAQARAGLADLAQPLRYGKLHRALQAADAVASAGVGGGGPVPGGLPGEVVDASADGQDLVEVAPSNCVELVGEERLEPAEQPIGPSRVGVAGRA